MGEPCNADGRNANACVARELFFFCSEGVRASRCHLKGRRAGKGGIPKALKRSAATEKRGCAVHEDCPRQQNGPERRRLSSARALGAR